MHYKHKNTQKQIPRNESSADIGVLMYNAPSNIRRALFSPDIHRESEPSNRVGIDTLAGLLWEEAVARMQIISQKSSYQKISIESCVSHKLSYYEK